MSDENEDIAMAECGSCRAIVPVNSTNCPECGISFSGVSDEALGECGACNALVALDSSKCPECGVVFVADNVVDILRTWMANNKMDVKTLFGRFDTNDDNMIDSGELKEGLLSLNLADLPPSQVDKLVAAIDEDGDSLIDLVELQTIIGGEELPETVEDSSESDSNQLEFNENVLEKVMKSHEIDPAEKESFVAFASDFNDDGNSYLKKEELVVAAEAWNSREQEDQVEVSLDDSEDDEIDDVEDSKEEQSDDIKEEDTDDEETAIEEDIVELTTGEDDTDDADSEKVDDSEDEENVEDEDEHEEVIHESEDDESQDIDEEYQDDEQAIVRSNTELIEHLLDVIEEQDKSLASAFGDLDDDGNRLLSSEELVNKLNEILPDGINQAEADALLSTMDSDGDGDIDMIEFVTAIENHEESISTIEDEEAETVKTFPSGWQTRFMSKKWHDVYWPLIHASFSILIVGLLVNGIFPIVDGTGGMVDLEIREDSLQTEWQMDNGQVVSEGEAYPCDPAIQEGECKNSLTPLAGKASSMPGGFYWDAIAIIVLAGVGLVWSLYTHLIRAPGWRARVKAMKDVDVERTEVQEAIDETEDAEVESEDEENVTVEDESMAEDEDKSEEEFIEDEEESAPDIGDYVGLDIDGEEYYGTILEFDDDEDTVVIEDEETGDEIVGYQDEMFIPEE